MLDQRRKAASSVSDIARRPRQARQSVQRVADLLVTVRLCICRGNRHHLRDKLLDLNQTGHTTLAAIDAAQHDWCDTHRAEIGQPALCTAAGRREVIATRERSESA